MTGVRRHGGNVYNLLLRDISAKIIGVAADGVSLVHLGAGESDRPRGDSRMLISDRSGYFFLSKWLSSVTSSGNG
jgi:hypothetical protein